MKYLWAISVISATINIFYTVKFYRLLKRMTKTEMEMDRVLKKLLEEELKYLPVEDPFTRH